MSVAKNPLDNLAIQALLGSSKERQHWIAQIRALMNATDPNQLMNWISQITSPKELTIIRAAGVPGTQSMDFFNEHSAKIGA